MQLAPTQGLHRPVEFLHRPVRPQSALRPAPLVLDGVVPMQTSVPAWLVPAGPGRWSLRVRHHHLHAVSEFASTAAALGVVYWRPWSRCGRGVLVCPRVQPAPLRPTGSADSRTCLAGHGRHRRRELRLGSRQPGVIRSCLRRFAAPRAAQLQDARLHRSGLGVGLVTERIGDDLFGRNIAIAARVPAEAARGDILVSESVHDAVGDDFAFGAVRKSR